MKKVLSIVCSIVLIICAVTITFFLVKNTKSNPTGNNENTNGYIFINYQKDKLESEARLNKPIDSFEYDGKYYYYIYVGKIKDYVVNEDSRIIKYSSGMSVERKFLSSKVTTASIEKSISCLRNRLEYDNDLKSKENNLTIEAGLYEFFEAKIQHNVKYEYYQNSTTTTDSKSETTKNEVIVQEQEELNLKFDSSYESGYYRVCKAVDFDVYLMVECPKGAVSIEDYSIDYDVKARKVIKELYEYSPDDFEIGSLEMTYDVNDLLNLPKPNRIADEKMDVKPYSAEIVFKANGGLFPDNSDSIRYNVTNNDIFGQVDIPSVAPERENYIFVGWMMPDSTYCTLNKLNEIYLRYKLNKTQSNIVINAAWIRAQYDLSDFSSKTVRDNQYEVYYKFNIQDLKTVLYRYSLKISGINVRFKVQEHDDGYQEFYLAKSVYKEIKDCTHTWDSGEVIVGESTIETVHGKKATGYFEKDYKVNLSKDDLPASNELYFYIGAHGKGSDKWTCSEVSVKFLLERK